MFKLTEDLVITIAVAVGLIVALALTVASVAWKLDFPPTITSAFLAIALAALTYRFLGGVGGAEFSIGLLKLGGSAAFVVGLIWFVGDRLREEQKLYSNSSTYREQIDSLNTQLQQAQDNAASQQARIDALQQRTRNAPAAQGMYTIEQIKKLPPTDQFVKDLKQLVEGQEGSFRLTVNDAVVRIAVIRTDSDAPLFSICQDTLDKLNQGIEVPSTQALISRSSGENETQRITARRSGTIGLDVCQNPERAFDIQINCPVALKLFPDVLTSCAEGAKARGMRVSIGALAE